MLNTKDWINATPHSKPNNGNKIANGTRWITKKMPVEYIKSLANPAITFNKVCPAIILAKSRIDKLIGLNKYEINSIGTNSKAKTNEVPDGKNKEKYKKPNFLIQMILIPI